MQILGVDRSEDEELIAIIENDTCAVDAIQVLTGCTFGKGNLCFRDYGRMVFTFASRTDGRSVRLTYQPTRTPEFDDLPESQRRQRRIDYMIAQDPSQFFKIQEDALTRLPDAARIRESQRCDYCGELVMVTRLKQCDDRVMCIPCYEDYLEEQRRL